MAHHTPIWMPCKHLHDLRERAKAEAARSRGKPYTLREYRHVKGRLISTLAPETCAALLRDSLADLDVRPPLPAERNYFDGKEWQTEERYRMDLEHARMIEEAEAAEAEAAPEEGAEAMAA